jgi:hypothetical protein
MAFVVATKPGRFEVRESRNTPKGPRSRTLATFGELTEEVIEKVRTRAGKPPSAAELRRLAAKAGAPVPGSEVDEAARTMLRALTAGARLDPMLRRLLLHALSDGGGVEGDVSDAARSASGWIGVGPEERASALRELLELTDALPVQMRQPELEFPRLRST